MDSLGTTAPSPLMSVRPADSMDSVPDMHRRPPMSDTLMSNNFEMMESLLPSDPHSTRWLFRSDRSANVPRLLNLGQIVCWMAAEVEHVIPPSGKVKEQTIVPLKPADVILPCGGFLAMFWKNVKILLNGSPAYISVPDRYLISYLESTLMLSRNSVDTWAQRTMIDLDEQPASMNRTNKAYAFREANWTTTSTTVNQTCYMTGELATDFNSGNGLLPNDVEITLDLERNPDGLLLYGGGKRIGPGEEYRIRIVDLRFFIRKPLIKTSIYMSLEASFARKDPARLYYYKTHLIRYNLPQGVSNWQSANLTTLTRNPAKLFVWFMKSPRQTVDYCYTEFPRPEAMTSAQMLLDGADLLGLNSPYANTQATGQDYWHYTKLMMATQNYGNNQSSSALTFDWWKSTMYLLGADLTSSGLVRSDQINLLKKGNLVLDLRFSGTGLTEAWTCWIWAISASLLTINPGEVPSITDALDAPTIFT